MNDLDTKAKNNSLDIDERVAKRETKVSLAKLLREEEIKWALRAKVHRMVQMDDNTQFFYMIANRKHRIKKGHTTRTGRRHNCWS